MILVKVISYYEHGSSNEANIINNAINTRNDGGENPAENINGTAEEYDANGHDHRDVGRDYGSR